MAKIVMTRLIGRRTDPWPRGVLGSITVALVVVDLWLYVQLEATRMLVPWVTAAAVLFGSMRLMQRWFGDGIDLWRLARTSFLVLSAWGLVLYWNHQSLYGVGFGPDRDDSLFFNQIEELLQGASPRGLTLWQYVMAAWARFVALLGVEGLEPLALLPLNWAAGAATIAVSVHLAQRVAGKDVPWLPVLAALLGNSIVVVNFALLYRDALAILLFLICLAAAVEKRYVSAVVFALLAGLVRGANGFLALAGIMLIHLGMTRRTRKGAAVVVTAATTLLAVGLFVESTFQLNAYFRSFLDAGREGQTTTLAERASTRLESRLGGGGERAEMGTMDRLYRAGPVGWVVMPAAAIFSPMRLINPLRLVRVNLHGEREFEVFGLRLSNVLDDVTVLLWILVGPWIVVGSARVVRSGTPMQIMLLLLVLLALLGVTFVSSQVRHRLAFIVLYPYLITMVDRDLRFDRMWLRRLTVGFAVLLIGVNAL